MMHRKKKGLLLHHGLGDAIMFMDLLDNDPGSELIVLSENTQKILFQLGKKNVVLFRWNDGIRNRYVRFLVLFLWMRFFRNIKEVVMPVGYISKIIRFALFPILQIKSLPQRQELLSQHDLHRKKYFGYSNSSRVRRVNLQSISELQSFFDLKIKNPDSIVISPFAGGDHKNISVTLAMRLLMLLNEGNKLKITIFGAEKDRNKLIPYLSEIDKSGMDCDLVTSNTVLMYDSGWFERFDLVIAADSGVAHFISKLRVELLVLHGPTNGHWTGAEGPFVTILQSSMACAPCQDHNELKACSGLVSCLK